MNFLGEQAISGATRATGRTTLVFSGTLVFGALGWIQLAETSIIGLKFEQGKFLPVLAVLVVISAIAHFVQWYSDLASYRGWNIHGQSKWAGRASAAHNKRFHGLVEDLISAVEELGQDEYAIEDMVSQILPELKLFNTSLRNYGRYAKLYVYGWHFAVPILAALIALGMYFHNG